MEDLRSSFVPLGGMNTDDDLISIPRGNAGDSFFGSGDYRYALNARIGSSRSDHFGAVENMPGTTEVTAYYAVQEVFDNYDFEGSLGGWSQIASSPSDAWTYSGSNSAMISPTLQTVHNIIYQEVSGVAGTTVSLKYRYTYNAITTFSFEIVFLDGTTELSSLALNSSYGTIEETVDVDIPANCDGLGFRIDGQILIFPFYLEYVKILTFNAGTRPDGTNRTIGRYEDREFQQVYFCNYNSNGDHTICRYDKAQNAIYELLKWDGLNFSEGAFVKMAKLDNWMAFTDRENAPRLIDVDDISDVFTDLGESDFREFHISFHKWSPIAPPVPRVFYDSVTNNYEKLKNKIYQFAYRYIYRGNLKSRWSPISKGAITTSCGFYYGAGSPGPDVDKRITSIEVEVPVMILDQPDASVEYNYFGYDDVKFTTVVIGIELAFREGERELWKQWKTVKKDNFDRYYYFNGDANQTPIPDDDFYQPFDTVPFKAGTVEAVDNRFVFGDCVDELDPVEDMSITDVAVAEDPTEDWDDSFTTSFNQFTTGDVRERLLRMNSMSNFTFKPRGLYKVGVVFFHHTGWRSAVYTNDSWIYNINNDEDTSVAGILSFKFKFGDSFSPPDWAVAYQIVRTNCLNIGSFMYGSVNAFIPLIDKRTALNALAGFENLPEDVKNRLFDHFENSRTVNGYDIASKSSEVISEEEIRVFKLLGVGNLDRLNQRKGASPQTISKLGNRFLTKYLRNNPLRQKLGVEIRDTIIADLFDNASRIAIDIGNWYNASRSSTTKDNRMNKLFYNFIEGDRVRFVGSTVAAPTTNAQTQVYDALILEFSGTMIIIEKPEGLKWTGGRGAAAGLVSSRRMSIEVYSPQTPTQEDHVFYETGEFYPILFPGTTARDFSKRDWDYENNEAVTVDSYGPFDVFSKMPFFYGDTYNISKLIYRTTTTPNAGPSTTNMSITMNPDPDKSYDFWERNNGRASIAYDDLPTPRFKTTMARFGGKIVEESNINALARFRNEDQFIYPSEYGRIRDFVNTSNAQVESVGSILLAIGEREAWSIYVNRTTLEDLSGRTQVSLSQKVLGSYNTLLGGHGTLNPESISKERGNVFWWDALSGAWIQYGRDGLTEFSGYKMKTWFRDIGKLLQDKYLTSTPPRVISEYDLFHDDVIIFINHADLPSTFRGYSSYKGAMFRNTDNRWEGLHDYTPEFFSKVGTQTVAFLDGRVYLLESDNDNHSTFFGEKKDVYIEPVMNQDPKKNKHWRNITECATDPWSVERIQSEYRGSKQLIQSDIPLASFQDREDTWWADIKQNSNTPNVTDPRINGAPVICKAIQVLMKLDPSLVRLSLLHYVDAGYTESKRNP